MAVRVDTDAEGLELALSGFSTYPYTLMAWFRPVTLPNTSTELAMGLGGASANQFDALSFPSGTWQLQLRMNGGTALAGSTLTTNVWYHLALVRSANTGTGVYLAYLNGVLDITGTSTWNQTNTFTRSFLGWGSAESTTRTVRGDYGIAKFYTAALSADEIYREVNSIRPTRLSDLYAWLPTFPGSGERNRDYSGNGRNFAENGTLSDTDHPPVSWGNKTWVIPWVSTGGHNVAINQVTETDTAQSAGRLKNKSVAQAQETDLAQAIGVQGEQIVAIGQVTETDTAQAMQVVLGTRYVDGYGGDVQTYQDNLLNSSAPTFNLGAHSNFEYSPSQNCLLRFNLSAIQAGYECLSATLYMTKSYELGDGGGTPVVNVYSIAEANKDWQAGVSDLDLAEEDESCWNALAADGAGGVKTAWAGGANGCGISGTDYEATPIGSITIDDPELDPQGTEYAIELDADRVAGWFGAANTNYGIVIKTTGGGDHWGQSDNGTAAFRPKLVVYYKVAHAVALNQVAETDAAQPLAKLKANAIGQGTESDASQSVSRLKGKAVAQVAEVDLAQSSSGLKLKLIGQSGDAGLAQSLLRLKSLSVGQVAESDFSQVLSRLKSNAIGQSEEVDSIFSVLAAKAKGVGQAIEINEVFAILVLGESVVAIGQVSETNLAQVVASLKTKAIAQVNESDATQQAIRVKSHELGMTSETNVALALSGLKAILIGSASEVDIAQSYGRAKAIAVLLATEADFAQSLSRIKAREIGQVSETDLAQIISVLGAYIIAINQVAEADTAQPVLWSPKNRLLSQATEVDLAQLLFGSKVKVVEQASETDLAQSLARLKRREIGRAVEADIAQVISLLGEYIIALAQAIEIDTAQHLSWSPKNRLLLQAVENGISQAVTRVKSNELGLISETDLAHALSSIKAKILGQTSETDVALALFGAQAITNIFDFVLSITRSTDIGSLEIARSSDIGTLEVTRSVDTEVEL